MSVSEQVCDRCKKKTLSTIMSILNQQMICNDCKDHEKEHPRYKEAAAAELEAVLRGNYNYPGLLHGKDLGTW